MFAGNNGSVTPRTGVRSPPALPRFVILSPVLLHRDLGPQPLHLGAIFRSVLFRN